MPTIQVPNNISPKQIEFEEGIERSKPGALYFTPGSIKTITKSELEYLRKKHKYFASRLIIVSEEDVNSRLKKERQKNSNETTTIKPKNRISTHKRNQAALLKAATATVSKTNSSGETKSPAISKETNDSSDSTTDSKKKNTSKKK